MGQYKLWVTWSLRHFALGVHWNKRYVLKFYILPFTIAIGLTPEANGFSFWKD